MSSRGKSRYITSRFLEESLSGFVSGVRTTLVLTASPSLPKSYHSYSGGPIWIATLPSESASPGRIMNVSASLLTTTEFVANLKPLLFPRGRGTHLPDVVTQATRFTLENGFLSIRFDQHPAVEGVQSFSLNGRINPSMKCVNGKAKLEFLITDIFGFRRTLGISHDGHGPLSLTISANGHSYNVRSVHSDGVRTTVEFRFRYFNPNVVTFYDALPLRLYRVGRLKKDVEPSIPEVLSTFVLDSIKPLRRTERDMLFKGSKYDLGRVGAEIALCVAMRILRIDDLIMNEPSKGGKDLFTRDRRVVIQSRLLRGTRGLDAGDVETELIRQMGKLAWKLGQDFEYNPPAERGFAILSYLTKSDNLRTIVAEVDKSRLTELEKDGPARI